MKTLVKGSSSILKFLLAPIELYTLSLLCLVASVSAAEPAREASDTNAARLPLSGVILYSSGVGYFERRGEVDGEAQINLSFKVDDVNDLLKSMVVQDFNGGHISAVTYGSRDPI